MPVEEPPRKPPMAMPNVFVVPPEEDQTPPWCFFHAENPELSQIAEQSETPEHSAVFEMSADSPSQNFSRDVGSMPGKNFETVSIVEALLRNRDEGDDSESETSFEGEIEVGEDEDEDAHSIQENDRHESSRDHDRGSADDSDVIEVVKVSRRKSLAEDRGDSQSVRAFSEFKRSGTLKSRASKVFRSLRGTLRSKPRAQDIFPPPLPTRRASQKSRKAEPSERETVARPRTPTISRRGSGVLSQLFTAPSIKPRTSISSFNERISVPDETDQPPSPPMSPQSSHFGSVPLSRRTSVYTLGQEDETRLRAASPTPTTISSKSTNRRRSFSIMKLFSFSSSNTASTAPASPMPTATIPYDESDRATPTQHSNSSTPSATSSISTVSSPQPQTPTNSEEITPVRLVTKDESTEPPMFGNFDSVFETNVGLNLGLGLSLDDLNESSISSQQTTPRKSERSNNGGPSRTGYSHDDSGDTSLEMRLDSFHFDDLSFDANRF
ncbi:hypothetical protein CVT25_006425 [Psilocybe cyanescens]|uniref:Uncharacterized protein n=1 Tax=Psilocybe cyanescens TaxID=93625 RepID=A0A409XE53_PSICY|nr:hypothetical protein CVT25_006425 [Psilocybe cyanescens]